MRNLIHLATIAFVLLTLKAAGAAELNDPQSSLSNPAAVSATPPTCDDLPDTRPVFDTKTKKFKGCRVTSVKTGSGYDKMGLKTGDLVQPDSGKARSMQDVNQMESGTSR